MSQSTTNSPTTITITKGSDAIGIAKGQTFQVVWESIEGMGIKAVFGGKAFWLPGRSVKLPAAGKSVKLTWGTHHLLADVA